MPVGATPAAREDRIAELERGVRLDEKTATVIGAVGSKKVNFVVDMPVVGPVAPVSCTQSCCLLDPAGAQQNCTF